MNDNFLTYNEYSAWKDMNECCTNPYRDTYTAQCKFDDELIERIKNEVIKKMRKKLELIDEGLPVIEKYHLKHR